MRTYSITPLEDNKTQKLVFDQAGKIVTLPMPDIKGELPTQMIDARSPIEAIKQYWKKLKVEWRSAKLQVQLLIGESYRLASPQPKRIYFVSWEGYNEAGGGVTWWFIIRSKEEHEVNNFMFGLPESRFIGTT